MTPRKYHLCYTIFMVAKKGVAWLSAAALLAVSYLVPVPNVFNLWDFRNNLWAPAHLLVSGLSPYQVKLLFPDVNAVWMPPVIGALFPIGVMDFTHAGRVWLMVQVLSIGFLVFLCLRPLSPVRFALGLLAVFFFPSVVTHISLGQISLIAALLLLLAAGKRPALSGLLCALALTKPQLCILVLPGLVIAAYRRGGWREAFALAGFTLLWLAAFTVPLFAGYPDWMPGMLAALRDNADWAQPSLRFALRNVPWAWAVLAASGFALNIWLWLRKSERTAAVWSLALTVLVSPYVWSWDFVLILPLLLHLAGHIRRLAAIGVLAIGFIAVSLRAWSLRWGTSVGDDVFWFLAPALVALCALAVSVETAQIIWTLKVSSNSSSDVSGR